VHGRGVIRGRGGSLSVASAARVMSASATMTPSIKNARKMLARLRLPLLTGMRKVPCTGASFYTDIRLSQPSEDLRFFQGSFYNARRISSLFNKKSEVHQEDEVAAECYYHLSVVAGLFKEVQMPVLVGDPAALPSEEERRRIKLLQHECQPFCVSSSSSEALP